MCYQTLDNNTRHYYAGFNFLGPCDGFNSDSCRAYVFASIKERDAWILDGSREFADHLAVPISRLTALKIVGWQPGDDLTTDPTHALYAVRTTSKPLSINIGRMK